MQLRRREREQALEAGACDGGGEGGGKEGGGSEGRKSSGGLLSSSPTSWSSPGDPCSHLDEDDDGGDEAWEVEQAALLGWRRLDLSGSTAPRSLLDRDAPRPPPRKTPRDPASILAAAEALSRAVNGAGGGEQERGLAGLERKRQFLTCFEFLLFICQNPKQP